MRSRAYEQHRRRIAAIQRTPCRMISAFRFAATLVVVSAAMGWFHSPGWAQSPAMPSELPPLRTGDIVFQTSSDDQALAIALASRSSFTHTALVEIDERGSANVVEAAGTVHTTPLAKWIKHGTGGRIVVKRFTGLNEAIARRMLKSGSCLRRTDL